MTPDLRIVVDTAIAHLHKGGAWMEPKVVKEHLLAAGPAHEGHVGAADYGMHKERFADQGFLKFIRDRLNAAGHMKLPSTGVYENTEQLAFEGFQELIELQVRRGTRFFESARQLAALCKEAHGVRIDVDDIIRRVQEQSEADVSTSAT